MNISISQKLFSSIPVQVAPQPDEWIETYLVRVARSIGMRCPTQDDINHLRQIYVADKLQKKQISTYFSDLPAWSRRKLGSQIRYCPACFEKNRFVRTRWRIPAYEMCTEHFMYLKSGVIEPSLTFEYNHSNVYRLTEINDGQVWEGATCPMPRERNLALAFWKDFDFEIQQTQTASHEKLAWIIAAENLLDAIISSPVGPEVPLKHETRLKHKAQWLSGNGLTLTPSFNGLLSFLVSLRNYREIRAAATRLKYMVKDCENGASILRALPLQDLYSRFLAVKPDIYCPIANGALPAQLQPKGYLSLNLAEGLLGQKSKFLYFLLRSNFFKKIEKIKNGGRTYVFIHESEVEGCRRWLSGCMTSDQVMQYLQIDRLMYSALLRSRVLEPIEMGRWSLFRRDDIALITNKFDSVALPCPEDQQIHPLLKTFLKIEKRQSQVFYQLVKEIWNGNIPLYRKLDDHGLQSFYVDNSVAVIVKQLMADNLAEQRRKAYCVDQPSLF